MRPGVECPITYPQESSKRRISKASTKHEQMWTEMNELVKRRKKTEIDLDRPKREGVVQSRRGLGLAV